MELREYAVRICVAGSRSYHDSISFDAYLRAYVKWLLSLGVEKFAFISGGAKRGPDAMIIEWARRHDYKCFIFEADWDRDGRSAGMIRNRKMREELTHLLAFWDGESRGTEEMVESTLGMDSVVSSLIMVKPDSGWRDFQSKSKSKFKKKGFKRGWK